MIPFPYSRMLLNRRPVVGGGGGGYLLDTYGANCVGAWSMARKLRSAATQAFRAAWNSGASTHDVGFLGNENTDTASMLSAIGANQAAVTAMYDQSGNSRDVTQTFGSSAPRITNSSGVLDTFGGFPAPLYSGAQTLQFANFGTSASLTGNPAYSVFAVYAKTTSGNGHLWGWGNAATGTQAVGVYDDGSLATAAYGGGQFQPFIPTPATTLSLLSVLHASGTNIDSTTIRRNGSNVETGTGSSSNPGIAGGYPLNLGAWADGGGSFLGGRIIEVLIYADDKTTDLSAIESDIRTYYGI